MFTGGLIRKLEDVALRGGHPLIALLYSVYLMATVCQLCLLLMD